MNITEGKQGSGRIERCHGCNYRQEECMPTIPEALNQALAYHSAGQFEPAEQIYRQILQFDPLHAEAWHLLGVVAYQVGQHAVAVDHIGRAIAFAPSVARY